MIVLLYGFTNNFEDAKQMFLRLPGAGDLSAVRNERIIAYPEIQGQGDPVAIEGIETLAKALEKR